MAGLEPAASRFQGGDSTHLSYTLFNFRTSEEEAGDKIPAGSRNFTKRFLLYPFELRAPTECIDGPDGIRTRNLAVT